MYHTEYVICRRYFVFIPWTIHCPLNPLNPNSDQHQISPCNINAYTTTAVMTIKDMIT